MWLFLLAFLNSVYGYTLTKTSPDSAIPDVIWMAPFFSGGGYCSEAIDFVTSLANNASVRIYQHGDSYNNHFYSNLPVKHRNLLMWMKTNEKVDARHAITICHSEPGAWYPANYDTQLCPEHSARYKIGRTMFETDRLPLGWESRLNRMNEIWVPGDFHKDIFIKGGVKEDKIFILPESVDINFYNRDTVVNSNKFPFKFPNERHSKPFKFLSVFKWEKRKGWDILLEAFVSAFTASDSVVLYILTNAYHDEGASFESKVTAFIDKIKQPGQAIPSIRVLTYVTWDDMPALYASVDCFVLPTRGEGWGRPIVEAMAMSLPVIVTNWSGQTAYINEFNSYPLRIQGMDVVEKGAFQGHKWAKPDKVHLVELMKEVFANPEKARMKGLQGRHDMVTKYCPECVNTILINHLKRIRDKILSQAGESLYYHEQTSAKTFEEDQFEKPKAKPLKTVQEAKEEMAEYYRNNPKHNEL